MSEPFIYLASASPRRKELLSRLGVRFKVLPSDIDETPQFGESVSAYVRRVAQDKALSTQSQIKTKNLPEAPVMGADTCVVVDGRMLGKPVDRRQAREMLTRLQDRTHQVYTAVCLLSGETDEPVCTLSCSDVEFGPLSQAEIEAYCDTGEPMDKAGAYGIQGRAGAFVKAIHGSYSSIVGLPLYETRRLLMDLGIL